MVIYRISIDIDWFVFLMFHTKIETNKKVMMKTLTYKIILTSNKGIYNNYTNLFFFGVLFVSITQNQLSSD